jgi:DGQHR domain-containing protein
MRSKKRSGKRKKRSSRLIVRALKTKQGEGIEIYSFFLPGGQISRIADITRLERGATGRLKGFQRKEIKSHVRAIVQFLNQGSVLFPNAIILALSRHVTFQSARGGKPDVTVLGVEAGRLFIPVDEEGTRQAWIVDGQQRSIALSEAKDQDLLVPVVGFVSDEIATQREQFILVNKARPLPTRLINELLPETSGVILPRDLAARRIPSELCGQLDRDQGSPFYHLVKRLSDVDKKQAVITDTAIIKMIRNSINSPLGGLAPFKSSSTDDSADIRGMYRTLCTFWSVVRDVFPAAWGLPPEQSRLMHSAGIEAMGVLMDKMIARHGGRHDEEKAIRTDLQRMAPECHWTEGVWEGLNLEWNEIQNTPKHIRGLADTLVRLYSATGVR